MRKLYLSNGGFALVDNEDFEELSKYTWLSYCGYAYRPKSKKYGNEKNVSMHVHILGKVDGMEIDHINGNKLDNRKENLRHATRSQNQANKTKYKNNKSGYKGVRFAKGGWIAQITKDRKTTHIGFYKTAEEAAKAYDEKAKEIHRGFALLNFP